MRRLLRASNPADTYRCFVLRLASGVRRSADGLARRLRSSMKVLCVGDLYFERVAVIGYVAWGGAGAPAGPHLSMANIGKGQFPSDHRQRNSNER
jgi:hypothetical protein